MKIKAFVKCFIRDIIAGDTFAVAGELTYKLMLSMFPLITFLLSLLGFLELDIALLDELASPYLPQDIHATLLAFIHGLTQERNTALLSLSFIVALVSSSSGFRAMMRGICKVYGTCEERSFVTRAALSVALTLMFTAAVVAAIVAIIFRDAILIFFEQQSLADDALTAVVSYLAAFGMMLTTVSLIYKVSAGNRKLKSVLPGSFFTVCLWLVSSQIFNFYVTNFPVFSLYGGIASAFLMLLWLNIISVILLFGAQLNARLEKGEILQIDS